MLASLPRAPILDPRDFVRPEVERQPEFHPQLARAIADLVHRLTALAPPDAPGASSADPPSVEQLGALVAELRALLDEFAPSVQVVMTSSSLLLAALPLERARVPLGTQLQWVHALCVPHLVETSSFREAEAHINGAKRFLEGQPAHANGAVAQPTAVWSRALACAMLPFWARALSAASKHVGAQLAITTRNLCTVIAECAQLRNEGGGGGGGTAPCLAGDALCALVATNSLVAIISHWTRALRRPAGAHAHGGDEAQWALSQARMGWQGELLLSGVHVLLELLLPGASAAPAAAGGAGGEGGALLHAAAVGVALLLGGSAETLHQLEAMRVMRAHAGRPLDQYAPPGLETSGACFSQRIVRAAIACSSPAQPTCVTDAGLVLLCALHGDLWAALLAIVPADAMRLARALADVRWRRGADDAPGGPQPLGSFHAIGERLLYGFMEHVCALHRRACCEGDASSAQLLLLPLLTASELREDGFECAAVFFATAHRLSRDA